jgi:excisionase family DNA binding protein
MKFYVPDESNKPINVNHTPGQGITKNTLTFNEAWSEIFECSISKDKLYAEVRAGRLPHVKIGSKILFRRDAMADWFKQQEKNNLRPMK